MKLTLGTTFWGRPRIELLTARYYQRLAEEAGVDVELVACVSEDWAAAACEAHDWRVVRAPNQPLGQKHNVMLSAVRETKPDAFILVGSDDWLVAGGLNPFDAWAQHAHQPLTGIVDLWVVDLPTKRAARWANPPHPIGAGRMIRSDVLDAAEWTLWAPHAQKGLDASMARKLRGRWHVLDWADGSMGCIDFKSGTNIWGFDAFEGRATACSLRAVLGTLPTWAQEDLAQEWAVG